MPARKADPASFLKSRDPATLPKRGGRAASTFYPELVKAFLEKGEKAMEVDVAKLGRKPETVRAALVLAGQQKKAALVETLKARLRLYEAGTPYREAQ